MIREPARQAEHVGHERIVRPNEQRRPGGLAHGHCAIKLGGRGLGRQVGFDEEHRRRIAIEAEVMHVVDRGDRELVEQFERDRLEAARGHAGHGPTGGFERREERQERRFRGGGVGISLRVASVTRPSVPCDPTKSCVRL